MTFEEYYTIGENYYDNGEYEKALEHFKKCISLDDYYNCIDYIGLCYLHLKQYKLAAKAFKEIMNNCQQSAIPVINLGRVYLYQGLLTEAFKMFNKAISIDPNDEDAYFYLGVYYNKVKNYEESIRCYKKSLSINTKQSETHLNLGVCYYRFNLYNEALNEFDLAYKFDNECIDAKKNKGIIYLNMENYTNALDELLFIDMVDSDNLENIIDIAHCYYKLNDFKNMNKWIIKALEIDPENEYANKMMKKLQRDSE